MKLDYLTIVAGALVGVPVLGGLLLSLLAILANRCS
jgi:hypothetical protein